VPLDDGVLEALSRHLAANPRTGGLIFTTPEGKALDVTRAYGGGPKVGWFRKAARTAGLSDEITLHDLRHFYASLLIRNGANVKLVHYRGATAARDCDPTAVEGCRAGLTRAATVTFRRGPACLRDDVGQLPHHAELLVPIQNPDRRKDLHPNVLLSPATLDTASAGRSWMNAAVLFRNIAMSGTFSHRITAAARSLASACLLVNVPSAA
jgi:hypothetical protein